MILCDIICIKFNILERHKVDVLLDPVNFFCYVIIFE